MDESSNQPIEASLAAAVEPDGMRLRRWFAAYGAYLAAMAIALAIVAAVQVPSARALIQDFRHHGALLKLLGFAIYMSICCTFLPLPANVMVAAVSVREVAVGPNWWTTALLVAAVGAAASTMANLNDYHLFTWMLRNHRIRRVRQRRFYKAAVRWFERAPFTILVIFNLLPIPIDVVRMLATSHRYPRLPFAAANALGRFIRYVIIVSITYALGKQGWVSVVALLGVAVALGVHRLIAAYLRRRRESKETVA